MCSDYNTAHASATVFVTGNANKLKEVRAILADGHPIKLESRALDRKSLKYQQHRHVLFQKNVVPEIQGSTQEVAREKCRRAAEIVRAILLRGSVSLTTTSNA